MPDFFIYLCRLLREWVAVVAVKIALRKSRAIGTADVMEYSERNNDEVDDEDLSDLLSDQNSKNLEPKGE